MSFFSWVHKFWDFYIPDKLFFNFANNINFLNAFSLKYFLYATNTALPNWYGQYFLNRTFCSLFFKS